MTTTEPPTTRPMPEPWPITDADRKAWARAGRQRALEALRLRKEAWPDALVKAAQDEFDYACHHATLGVIRFCSASRVGKGWVRLSEVTFYEDHRSRLPYPFPRGVDVRVADLTWVCDAPQGS